MCELFYVRLSIDFSVLREVESAGIKEKRGTTPYNAHMKKASKHIDLHVSFLMRFDINE